MKTRTWGVPSLEHFHLVVPNAAAAVGNEAGVAAVPSLGGAGVVPDLEAGTRVVRESEVFAHTKKK